jgi:hypothetical protein
MSRESVYPPSEPDGLENRDLPPMAVRIVVYRGVKRGVLEFSTDGLSWQGGGFDAEIARLRRNLHHAADGLVDKIIREGWTTKGVETDEGAPE